MVWVSYLRNLCLTLRPEDCPLCHQINFFLALTFKAVVHFELIFVWGISGGFKLIFLHVDIQLSQHHLVKKLFLTQ